jgi:hypothetical protein
MGEMKPCLADVALALSYYTSKRDGELNNHERVIMAVLKAYPRLISCLTTLVRSPRSDRRDYIIDDRDMAKALAAIGDIPGDK